MTCKFEEALKSAGQHDALRFWDELSGPEKETMEAELQEVDKRIGLTKLKTLLAETSFCIEKQDAKAIEPPRAESYGYADTDSEQRTAWQARGLELIAKGKCAACVLAGGQGSRLGSTFPKGVLGDKKTEGADIGLPSGSPLFCIHAKRILRLQQLAKEKYPSSASSAVIPWLVMTSQATHAFTTQYFEANNYFGLDSKQVMFFQQGRMPCLDPEGNMLLAAKGSLQMSPDGNGGIYPALSNSGALEWLDTQGVQYLQVYSVDNILIRVADPVFYGFCDVGNYDVAAKTMLRKDAAEAVGVFALRNGSPGVIEYSEIGEDRAKSVDEAGNLIYGAANPAIHVYTVAFLKGPALEYAARSSIWHIANKKIQTVDGPVDGIKMEAFIFDAFAAAKNFGLLQVSRCDEFSAIKNSEDKPRDNPKTALADLSRLHKSWLAKIGVDCGDRVVEVAPQRSYAGEELTEALWTEAVKGLAPQSPVYLS